MKKDVEDTFKNINQESTEKSENNNKKNNPKKPKEKEDDLSSAKA